MFSLNASHEPLESLSPRLDPFLAQTYIYLLSFDFFAAPLMTFSIVAMFFRNFTAAIYYHLHFFHNIHIFSDLNDKSFALANSIKKEHKKSCIVFTNVTEEVEHNSSHLIKQARDIRAICYRKDILSANFKFHSSWSKLQLYTIKDNEIDNMKQAVELMEKYRKKHRCILYVFTSRPECEYLLNKKAGEKNKEDRIIVRRINVVSSLINRILYENGCQLLYEHASVGIPRKISVILIGLGQYGMEMLKALVWYCQMYGYKLEINAYDKSPNVLDRLNMSCKELLDNQDSSLSNATEPGYNIHVYPSTDTDSTEFVQKLENLTDPTYILVALGNDEENIRIAVNVRMIFERIATNNIIGQTQNPPRPKIQAIVYNSEESKILKNINNHKNENYEIDFIGDVETTYTEKTLINSDLENVAKIIHMEYHPADTFYDYEYYYRSSCASAIHNRAVAWQLKDISLDEELLIKIEFLFRLAYTIYEPLPKSSLSEDILQNIYKWSHNMRVFANDLISQLSPGFSYIQWKNKVLLDKDLQNDKSEAITILLKQYKQIVDSINKSHSDHQDILGLNEPFTLNSLLKNSISHFDSKQSMYYCILVLKLMMLEHKRWSAYLRSDGYIYAINRNDLGKMHPDLCPFLNLSEKEKGKDLHVQLLIMHIKQIHDEYGKLLQCVPEQLSINKNPAQE